MTDHDLLHNQNILYMKPFFQNAANTNENNIIYLVIYFLKIRNKLFTLFAATGGLS